MNSFETEVSVFEEQNLDTGKLKKFALAARIQLLGIDYMHRYRQDTVNVIRNAYPLATKQVEIDLDDGVKVNYNKFGTALKKVTGLTGKA